MRVRPAGDDAEAFRGECVSQRLGIGNNLLGIAAEFRLKRLAEADGLRSDDVNQRPALHSWKNNFIYCGREFLFR